MKKIYVHGIEMYEQHGFRAYSESGLRKMLDEASQKLLSLVQYPVNVVDYSIVREQAKRIDLQNAKKIGKVRYIK